ncbi:MAG TPA: hypothetical protein VMW87_10675 [Spirochaetia bacterium]|nr:hypothetical protein [Spirochaetia bacterium]
MEINWKVSTAFAAAAFLLSILSGAIAGVGFGLLLLRAIIGAVAFAVVGAGVSIVVARYLPELRSLRGAEEPSDAGRSAGRMVDIVIPEEPVGEFVDGSESTEFPEAGDDVGETDGADDFIADSLVEEVEELSGDEQPDLPGRRASGTIPGESSEASEEASEMVSEEESRELLDADVERLPDIGGLAGSFDGETSRVASESEKKHSNDSTGRDDMDPEIIARALRTVLKRDQS